ncbi:hypothetical protein ABE79_02575 [Proteus mirabilis]|nr:hypothetical protein ABE79_02575 [Proteus mirabilis]
MEDKPLHDYTSHDADGFRYFAVSRRNTKRPAFEINLGTTILMSTTNVDFTRPEYKTAAPSVGASSQLFAEVVKI